MCKYIIISSLILSIQIICKLDFFIKMLIILKFSQHQWIAKVWNSCFFLLFWRLLAAHSLLETYFMRGDSDFPHTNCLQVSISQQKVDYFYTLPTSLKIYYLKLLLPLVTFFRFHHIYTVYWGHISWKKVYFC